MAAPDMQPSAEDERETTQEQQPEPTISGDDAAIPKPTQSPPESKTAEPPATSPAVELHSQAEEIIRQVEYYFSDENLPHDAHLLSKTGPTGQEWVSLNEILSWKKMRGFKPPACVKACLAKSEKLEVWKNKFIRRKERLRVPITATAKEDPEKERNRELVEKPWLTKNFLKPTGFEKNFVDVVTPTEYEQERKVYDLDESFAYRIENAVTRYLSKRKMHQTTVQIFTKFLRFGGFSSGPHMFTGGLTDKDIKEMDLDSEQIAQMKSQFAVAGAVLEGIEPDDGEEATWVVDFEGMAKAFLSSHFMAQFDWQDAKTVETTTNILCNFYNYLLVHDVCPEYKDQIMGARAVCEMAEKEFTTLAQANKHLPGNFNTACSTRCGGRYSSMRPADSGADWVLEEDKNIGLFDEEALHIFITGIFAHGSEACLANLQKVMRQELRPSIIFKEGMGLEVVRIEKCSDQAKAIYSSNPVQGTIIKPTGKLHCIRWDLPHRPPKDLPEEEYARRKAQIGEPHEFLIEDEILQYCYPGLKLECVVKELNIGVKWIDSIEYLYPSFFNWTLNEPYQDWKEPGPPKEWMLRQTEREDEGIDMEVTGREGEEDETAK